MVQLYLYLPNITDTMHIHNRTIRTIQNVVGIWKQINIVILQ
jgi:hypothetical protein